MPELCGCLVRFFGSLAAIIVYTFCSTYHKLHSLIKDPQERPGPARMLEHPFIKRWEDVPMDVATWVKEVWDWK